MNSDKSVLEEQNYARNFDQMGINESTKEDQITGSEKNKKRIWNVYISEALPHTKIKYDNDKKSTNRSRTFSESTITASEEQSTAANVHHDFVKTQLNNKAILRSKLNDYWFSSGKLISSSG